MLPAQSSLRLPTECVHTLDGARLDGLLKLVLQFSSLHLLLLQLISQWLFGVVQRFDGWHELSQFKHDRWMAGNAIHHVLLEAQHKLEHLALLCCQENIDIFRSVSGSHGPVARELT
jgi:hypothetical protein